MLHPIELFSVLLFIAIGEGVLAAAPRPTRRVVISLAGWVLAFAAGITILAIPALAATAVRIGLLFLAVCIVRWIIGELVRFFHGPELVVAAPSGAELRDLAAQVTGLPERECRRIARRVARRQDGTTALLGLLTMDANEGAAKDVFEGAWQEASEKARALAVRIAEQRVGAARRGHAKAGDVLFVAHVLCLYEQDSVERVLARLPAALKGNAWHLEAAAQLSRSGRERKEAVRLGLVLPKNDVEAARRKSAGQAEPGIDLPEVLWPPLGLVRAGYRKRAVAVAISHAVLAGYGAVALLCGRDSGWVFLAAALLIHVQAAFAIGDFKALAARDDARAGAADGGQP